MREQIMKKEISVAPENSIILIMDQTIGDIPESMSGALVASTKSCVAVGTLSAIDGETLTTFSDEDVADKNNALVFDGRIDTPSKIIAVCTILGDIVFESIVKGEQTHLQIRANDLSEPDEINIVFK